MFPFVIDQIDELGFGIIALPISFFGIILALQFIIKHNYSQNTSITTILSPPIAVKIKRSYLFSGFIILILFVLLIISAFLDGEIFIAVFLTVIVLTVFKSLHVGHVFLWNKTILTISNKGINHYKYGFTPWSDILKIDATEVKHRGMKVGERFIVKIKKSYLSTPSTFRKNWEGILFKDSRLIIIPSFLSNISIDTLFSSALVIQRENGGRTINTTSSTPYFSTTEEKVRWFLQHKRYELDNKELEKLYNELSILDKSFREIQKKMYDYKKLEDARKPGSKFSTANIKLLKLGQQRTIHMARIKARTESIRDAKNNRLIIFILLLILIIFSIYFN